MSQITSKRPANDGEILTAFARLLVAFELYGDPHEEARVALLMESVRGEPLWAIRKAVDDFSFGRVSRKRAVFPPPHEFAPHVVRLVEASQRRDEMVNAAASGGKGRAYAAPVPQSRMIAEGIRKDEVRAIIDGMGYGPGYIWHPGSYGENADFGDLYEPDPKWKGPSPVAPTKQEQEEADRQRTEGERMSSEEYAAVRERAARIIKRSTLKRPPPARPPSMTSEESDRLTDDLRHWQHEAASTSTSPRRD